MSSVGNLYGLLFNARSIVNKLSELHYLLYCTNVDILVIIETWLHVDIMSNLFDPKGLFTVLRRDRVFHRGGGVCVLVRKTLRVIGIDIGNECEDLEMICFDLILTGNHTRFFALYRPPGYDNDALCYVCKLVKCLTQLESTKYPKIILGDVNLHKVNWNNFFWSR